MATAPEIFNHNLETIERLYPRVRPKAGYQQSLTLLREAKRLEPRSRTKSGLMVGLGEEMHEVQQLLTDLRAHDVEIVTIGQYLRPVPQAPPPGALLDARRVRGAQTVRAGARVQPRGERAAGAQLVPRARTGGGGPRGVTSASLEYLWLGQLPYGDAWALQRHLAAARARGAIEDVLLLVEHPPVYTMGRNGSAAHVPAGPEHLRSLGAEYVEVDRGGSVTFHGTASWSPIPSSPSPASFRSPPTPGTVTSSPTSGRSRRR